MIGSKKKKWLTNKTVFKLCKVNNINKYIFVCDLYCQWKLYYKQFNYNLLLHVNFCFKNKCDL